MLDLRGLADFTDWFLICHGASARQVGAIADAIGETLERNLGVAPGHVEGKRAGDWVLLDYIDFVVHVFLQERRAYYGLERLWGDAPRWEASEAETLEPPRGSRTPRRVKASRRRP